MLSDRSEDQPTSSERPVGHTPTSADQRLTISVDEAGQLLGYLPRARLRTRQSRRHPQHPARPAHRRAPTSTRPATRRFMATPRRPGSHVAAHATPSPMLPSHTPSGVANEGPPRTDLRAGSRHRRGSQVVMTIDLDADPFWLLPDETAVPVLAVLRVRDRIGRHDLDAVVSKFHHRLGQKADVTAHL
jgi:hypothetical protein